MALAGAWPQQGICRHDFLGCSARYGPEPVLLKSSAGHLGRVMVIATMLGMHHIMAKAVIVLSLQSPLLGYDVLARTSGARICSEDFLRYEMLGKCRCEPAPVLLTKFCNYCSRMLVITNQWKQKQCVIFCFYLLPKSARRIHNEFRLLFTCMHNALLYSVADLFPVFCHWLYSWYLHKDLQDVKETWFNNGEYGTCSMAACQIFQKKTTCLSFLRFCQQQCKHSSI